MAKTQLFPRLFLVCAAVSVLPALFTQCGAPRSDLKLESPSYTGGPAVIFRMDDGDKGAYQKSVAAIIEVFKKNHVPLDVGVIPFAKGRTTYDASFLKTFVEQGVISISMHGLEHRDREFDTRHSGKSYRELTERLRQARELFRLYYGVAPVAFTVPFDFFDEEGYRAVQDAGFKIFCTQKAVEPHPGSREPVDFSGKPVEGGKGMYRLCTVSDAARWDHEARRWGDIFPADRKNKLFGSILWGLKHMQTAVVGIHPQAFADGNDTVDPDKLETLDRMIKLARKYGTITTFALWLKKKNGT